MSQSSKAVDPPVAPSHPAEADGPPRRTWRFWLVATASVVILAALLRGFWLTPALNALANRALARQQPRTALVWTDRARNLAADSAETAVLEARAWRKLGDMQKVEESLDRARKRGLPRKRLQEQQVLALAQSGQMREAEPHLSQLLTSTEADPEEVSEAFALGFARNQKFSQSGKLLNLWMSDYPENAQPHFLKGKINAAMKNSVEAEADFRKALVLAPGRKDVVLELAEILRETNRPDDAIPRYEECLDDAELGVRARIGLAACLKSTGHADRALVLLQEAVAAAPENVKARKELGRIESENGDYEAAVRDLQAATGIAAFDDELRYLLAQALTLAGRPQEAAPHFQYVETARAALSEMNLINDALRANPGDVAALTRSGELLMLYADPNEAVLRLTAVLDLDPQNAKALELLANYYAERAKADPRFKDLAEKYRRERNRAE